MYGTTSAGDQIGFPYGQSGGYLAGSPSFASKAPFKRKRMNVVAICMGQFVPWLIFSTVLALLSFSWHYRSPNIVASLVGALCVALGLAVLAVMGGAVGGRPEEMGGSGPSWHLFLAVTSFLACIMAAYFGNHNFWLNMQPHYDVANLNTYNMVDPSRMRGQELMDAGAITFVEGTYLDLKRSMGFRNMDTYCVAPISGGHVTGTPQLAAYDFWAVGKNCCDPNTGGDFTCGEYNSPGALSGLRAVQDEDRAFYRLAVEQASSAYAIKANHPLFFYWVSDPMTDNDSMKKDGYKFYMVGMIGFFCFQLILVAGAARAFSTVL